MSSNIQTYISEENHLKVIRQEQEKHKKEFEIFRESFANSVNRLISRYARADNYLDLLSKRSEFLNSYGLLKRSLNSNLVRSFTQSEEAELLEVYLNLDKIMQMGLDFEILLKAMKKDEILANQWRDIIMTMRLAGYDKFQEEEK